MIAGCVANKYEASLVSSLAGGLFSRGFCQKTRTGVQVDEFAEYMEVVCERRRRRILQARELEGAVCIHH